MLKRQVRKTKGRRINALYRGILRTFQMERGGGDNVFRISFYWRLPRLMSSQKLLWNLYFPGKIHIHFFHINKRICDDRLVSPKSTVMIKEETQFLHKPLWLRDIHIFILKSVVWASRIRIRHYFARILNRTLSTRKTVRKTFISIILWLFFTFLSLNTNVNVPSKGKKIIKNLFFASFQPLMKKVQKSHGSTTLKKTTIDKKISLVGTVRYCTGSILVYKTACQPANPDQKTHIMYSIHPRWPSICECTICGATMANKWNKGTTELLFGGHKCVGHSFQRILPSFWSMFGLKPPRELPRQLY